MANADALSRLPWNSTSGGPETSGASAPRGALGLLPSLLHTEPHLDGSRPDTVTGQEVGAGGMASSRPECHP